VPAEITCESMGLHGIVDNNMAFLKKDNGEWKESKPIRTRARASSKTCGQGMTRCSCTGRYATPGRVHAKRLTVSVTLDATPKNSKCENQQFVE
jgi:hypothetical protein